MSNDTVDTDEFGEVMSEDCAAGRHESCLAHLEPTYHCACPCHKEEPHGRSSDD